LWEAKGTQVVAAQYFLLMFCLRISFFDQQQQQQQQLSFHHSIRSPKKLSKKLKKTSSRFHYSRKCNTSRKLRKKIYRKEFQFLNFLILYASLPLFGRRRGCGGEGLLLKTEGCNLILFFKHNIFSSKNSIYISIFFPYVQKILICRRIIEKKSHKRFEYNPTLKIVF
jgi:hypothetical protein